uniref:Uncharacterized protein n=1 Tax=Ditylenchus dipsaci TaxID=166011 RepID=A0A915DIP0_9BILA
MIHEYDASTLKFLLDISLQVHTDPTGSSLLFHFAGNPYFTNTVLTKYYKLKTAPDNDDPFGFCANVPCAKLAKRAKVPNLYLSQDLNPNLLCMQTPKLAKSLVIRSSRVLFSSLPVSVLRMMVLTVSEDSDGDSDGDDDEEE